MIFYRFTVGLLVIILPIVPASPANSQVSEFMSALSEANVLRSMLLNDELEAIGLVRIIAVDIIRFFCVGLNLEPSSVLRDAKSCQV